MKLGNVLKICLVFWKLWTCYAYRRYGYKNNIYLFFSALMVIFGVQDVTPLILLLQTGCWYCGKIGRTVWKQEEDLSMFRKNNLGGARVCEGKSSCTPVISYLYYIFIEFFQITYLPITEQRIAIMSLHIIFAILDSRAAQTYHGNLISFRIVVLWENW